MTGQVTLHVQQSSRFVAAEGVTVGKLRDHFDATGALPSKQVFDSLHLDAALSILGKCGNPGADERHTTSLVVGYVQSGKTISMTTLAAAARDNGYKIIVVLAGTTKNLVKQSRARFESYLRPAGQWWIRDSLDGVRGKAEVGKLRSLVKDWRTGNTPDEYTQTAFITVMKNHSHLKRLASLLRDAGIGAIPTLIIDDEADQASLNLDPANGQSTTYRFIDALRQVAKNHAYVQYTATPQAPLLISIMDALSPDSVTVLGAGKAYTGGETFFTPDQPSSPYVERLSPSDIAYMNSPGAVVPPDSLLSALRMFLLGVAAGYVSADASDPKKKRSMLVHPSRLKDDHTTFFDWVEAAKTRYATQLGAPTGSVDWQEAYDEFLPDHQSLADTQPGLPGLDVLLGTLAWAIAHVDVVTVNSDNASEVNWDNDYAHILVGGDKLNRGYTVEGLTVTYMPRGIGDGTVDTIQQRARFFGYKASYLGLCRVFLEPGALSAYRSYVKHETNMRAQLRKFENRPLNEWKRVLYLDPGLQPTRRTVLLDPLYNVQVGRREWYKMQSPHLSPTAVAKNLTTIDNFKAAHAFQPYELDNRVKPKHRHQFCKLPLRQALEELMVKFASVDATDNAGLFPLICLMADVAQSDPLTECAVVLMDDLAPRLRTARTDLSRVNLHAGEGGSETGYVGDAAVHESSMLTIQIHRLNVKADGGDVDDVHALAVWFPPELRSQHTIVEPTNVAA